MFNRVEVQNLIRGSRKSVHRTNDGYDEFDNNLYRKDFLYREFPIHFLQLTEVDPRPDEADRFARGRGVKGEEAVEMSEEVPDEGIEMQHQIGPLKQPFSINDSIIVSTGPMKNILGTIRSLGKEQALVEPLANQGLLELKKIPFALNEINTNPSATPAKSTITVANKPSIRSVVDVLRKSIHTSHLHRVEAQFIVITLWTAFIDCCSFEGISRIGTVESLISSIIDIK
jgi:hypothetical protein